MTQAIFDRFLKLSNFQKAYARIAAKKAAGGVDGMTVAEFGKNLDRRLEHLRREIIEGGYLPEATLGIQVPKFNAAREMRELGLPTVADKVVQAALLQVVEPLTEKMFHPTSYGYRLGKGHYRAIRQVEHNLSNRKLPWALHRDIDNFFDTLDHDRLLGLFSDLVKGDGRLVTLVAMWCKNGIVARDGRWRNVKAGVRQGQILSPLLANLYLHDLDLFAHGQGVAWVRYADDYLIQARDELHLCQSDLTITGYLNEHLKLRLNAEGVPAHIDEKGFAFLGVFFQKGERRIAEDKIAKMKRKLSYLLSPVNRATPADILQQLENMIAAWCRYYDFLRPAVQFAEIECHFTETLRHLIREKACKGQWPGLAPEGLMLPGFEQNQSADGREQRLARLWQEATRPDTVAIIKAKAHRQSEKRRRQHQRRVTQEGELYVLMPGGFVGKRGGRIIVRQKQEVRAEIIATGLRGLTLASHGIGLSSDVVSYCSEHDIPIHFLDDHGHIVSILQPPDSSRAEVVRLQALHQNDLVGLSLARMFVLGKTKNQLAMLKYFGKYRNRAHGQYGRTLKEIKPEMETIIAVLRQAAGPGEASHLRQGLMGMEGRFAANYWRLVSLMLPTEAGFPGRVHEGATDLVNAMLNYGYGVLYAKILTAAIQAGLNPAIGFLHAENRGKPVLTYDLIEEFRAPVVDRSVFTLLNRRERLEHEHGQLSETTRKKLAAEILGRLGIELRWHQGASTLMAIIQNQARAVIDHLRGSQSYRPFLVAW